MIVAERPVDVVVIGLGAAGGVAALPLTQAGLEVAGLEAGTWLGPRDFAPDELRNNYYGWPQAVQKANNEVPTTRRSASAEYSPRPALHPMMNAVGGTSLHWSAVAHRLNAWDFRVVSRTELRYGRGKIPPGSTVEDWPFGIEELEPFYDTVEHEIGVAGKAGNIGGQIDQAGNIFESPRSREYPMPPLRSTGFTDMMSAAARGAGWHPYPLPAAVNSVPYQGRPSCAYHGFCSGGGCHVDAKGSTAVTTIPKAMATNRLSVITRARVTRIAVGKDGRANGVVYTKDQREHFQPASVVLLASHVYENIRLLLLSESETYPAGLSNNHGQVGKHYFSHNSRGTVSALFGRDLNTWYGLIAQGVGVDDWADDNFDHSQLGFIGGCCFFVYPEKRPIAAARMPTFDVAPTWGSRWKTFVKENADRWISASCQRTTLPYETNYVDLDPSVKDDLGLPVCRITAEFKDNENRLAAFSQERLIEWYRAAGAIAVQRHPIGGAMGTATHVYGGTRMGNDPGTNVVDRWGFSHEVPNLGILGASVMGTSGAHTPTLTLQALAWRTAEHLVDNWQEIGQ